MSSIKGTSLRRPLKKLASASGAIDEEGFKNAFMSVSSIPIYSSRDLSEYLAKTKDNLSVVADDWEKRVNGLKDLRNVVASGGHQMDEFPVLLRTLEAPVVGCLQDLRSQVVREACITVAYFSQEIGNKFDHFAEIAMPTLLSLIPNSAKIMSTSGVTAIGFIIRNTFASRVFPIIAGGLSSKSSVLRRQLCVFLDQIFQHWPSHVLEKHMGLILESLRKGVSDADQDARTATRKALVSFAEKFPDNVEVLLRSLDPTKRKMVERALSNDDQSSVASGGSSRATSQTNLTSAPATTKRTNRPAMGASGLGGNATGRRPTVAETPRRFDYSSSRNRLGSTKTSISQPNCQSVVDFNDLNESTPKQCSSSARCSAANVFGTNDSQNNDAVWRGVADEAAVVSEFDEPYSKPASRETSPTRGGAGGSECDFNVHERVGPAVAQLFKPTGLYGTATVGASTGRRISASARLVPRSQGPSRDTSPNSAAGPASLYGAKPAYAASGQRPSLSSVSDAGFPQFNSHTYRQHYESDDNNSETSSMCSERSGKSMPVYRQNHMRPINGLGDIINLLRSPQWTVKKDGLVHLKDYLQSGQTLSPPEVLRVTEGLGSVFSEPSSMVVTPFMETLQLFIKRYHQHLHEWIYIALVRLFNRQGQEVRTNHQKAIADTFTVIRSHFPLNLQFTCCCRFIIDNQMTPSLKVKTRVLEYTKDLLVMMPIDAISNPTPEMVNGINRVIAWSTEPKSADVRRLASRVVIKLSDLNSAAFASVVQQMPKTSQDQSAKLLRTYQKTTNTATGGHDPHSPDGLQSTSRLAKSNSSFVSRPSGISSSMYATQNDYLRSSSIPGGQLPLSPNQSFSFYGPQMSAGGRPFSPVSPTFVPTVGAHPNQPHGHSRMGSIPDGRLESYQPPQSYQARHQPAPQPPYSAAPGIGTNETAQPTNGGTGNGHNYFPMAMGGGGGAGFPYSPAAGDTDRQSGGYSPLKDQQQSPLSLSGLTNDMIYPKLKKPVIGYQTLKKIREMPPEDALTEILQELSNYNDRYEQRKACMLKLIKLLRDGTVQTWDEHSKPTLLILLESLSDNSCETRALALRVLQELVRTQGHLISDYACLTVMKILEACNDADKGVNRSAEECAQTVARFLSQELCLRLLTTVISDNQTSLNLPAVKMQTQVIRVSSPELVHEVIEDLIPGLIAACSHDDSHMRKAGIFCLVQIALKFGEGIWEYLNDLNASKKRLLRIYIDRELDGSAKSNDSVRLSDNILIR